jgi:KDO2-lipid IV(A) lauroyltransferase
MQLKTRLSLLLAKVLSQVPRLLPLTVGYWLADRCGDLTYLLFPTYRRSVAENLAHVLGDRTNAPRVHRLARRTFQISARNFYDLLRMRHMSTPDFRRAVTLSGESRQVLARVLEAGKGGIVVTAHFSAFDFASQILVVEGYPLVTLAARTVPEFVYAAVTWLRLSKGMRLEDATPGGMRRVLQALRGGQFIGLLSDRDFFQNGVPVRFFGRDTSLPVGAAKLARQTGAPVVPVFVRRRDGSYELSVEEPYYAERTDDAERDVRATLEWIVSTFEQHIRESPEQWVMFQKVWTDSPPPALSVFPVGSPLAGRVLGRGADPSLPLTVASPDQKASMAGRDGARAEPAIPSAENRAAVPSGDRRVSDSSRTEARPGDPSL